MRETDLTLDDLVEQTKMLRRRFLAEAPEEGLDPVSSQHVQIGLAALDQARCHFELASLAYANALGDRRGRGYLGGATDGYDSC